MSAPDHTRPFPLALWPVWVPLLLGAAAYLTTLAFGFVWDDKHLIVHNTLIRQASALPALLSDFWQEGEHSGFYRPLVSLSYFVEFRLWRLSPAGYHAANLAYHLLATLAVTWAAQLLSASSLAALVAGTVFALHPVHTESVAFISGRPDVLAGAFLVASFALYVWGLRRTGRVPGWSVALFAAALLCKETALALPAVVAAWAFLAPEGPPDAGRAPGLLHRLGRLLWPYLATAGGYFCLRWVVLGAPLGVPGYQASPGARAVIALNALGDYLRLLVLPFPPAPDRLPDRALSAHSLAALAALALLAAAAAWSRRRSRLPAFLLAWFLLTLLPASPLVPGRPPQLAERFLYIPSVAWAWGLGLGAVALRNSRWLERPARRRAAGLAGVVLAASAAGATAIRSLDWRDEYHLFSRMAASEPRSYLAPLNLGGLALQTGALDQAESEFDRALRLRPNSAPALLGLAFVESRRGDHERAIRYAERARDLAPEGDLVYAQLGAIYGLAGRYAEAATSFRESIRRNPRRLQARGNLVAALADAGRLAEARDALAAAELQLTAESYQDPADIQMIEQLRRRVAAARSSP